MQKTAMVGCATHAMVIAWGAIKCMLQAGPLRLPPYAQRPRLSIQTAREARIAIWSAALKQGIPALGAALGSGKEECEGILAPGASLECLTEHANYHLARVGKDLIYIGFVFCSYAGVCPHPAAENGGLIGARRISRSTAWHTSVH